MIRINAYLIKVGYTQIFKYKISDNIISENGNSIFDQDVCLSGQRQIELYIKSLKQDPKILFRADSPGFEIYYRNKEEYEPEWKKFWRIEDIIKQRTADCIVILHLNHNILAICHGHSSSLLNPYAVEPYFGLRTAINMLDPRTINSADFITPASLPFQTRKRTGTGADFNDFEINTLTTLLKNISGKVKEEYEELVKNLDGADNLSFTYSKNPEQLTRTLEEFLAIHNLDTYTRTVFKYIDNFAPLKDKNKIDILDKELLNQINKKNPHVSLFTPFDINFPGAFSFKFNGLGNKNNVFNSIDIRTTLYKLINETNKVFTSISELTKPIISIIDYNDPANILKKYPLYRCLYFEIKEETHWYFIESGVWYEVKRDFSDKIDKAVDSLITDCLEIDITFSKEELLKKHFKEKKEHKRYENWFNHELAEYLSRNGATQCLDSDNITLVGYDKIEVCDVIFVDPNGTKYLFHNKYKYGSSSLSHLFSQGNVSAELLANPEFRIKVNKKINDDRLKYEINDDFNPRNNIIVFGIISPKENDGSFSIPLFSKINLKLFVDSLKSKSLALPAFVWLKLVFLIK